MREIREKFLEKFGFEPGISSIHRYIKGFKYSIKALNLVPIRRNDADAIQERYDYAIQYTRMMVDRHEMFFIDGFRISISTERNHGWSKIGEESE